VGLSLPETIILRPGLLINDTLACSGRPPAEREITTWLATVPEA